MSPASSASPSSRRGEISGRHRRRRARTSARAARSPRRAPRGGWPAVDPAGAAAWSADGSSSGRASPSRRRARRASPASRSRRCALERDVEDLGRNTSSVSRTLDMVANADFQSSSEFASGTWDSERMRLSWRAASSRPLVLCLVVMSRARDASSLLRMRAPNHGSSPSLVHARARPRRADVDRARRRGCDSCRRGPGCEAHVAGRRRRARAQLDEGLLGVVRGHAHGARTRGGRPRASAGGPTVAQRRGGAVGLGLSFSTAASSSGRTAAPSRACSSCRRMRRARGRRGRAGRGGSGRRRWRPASRRRRAWTCPRPRARR